MRWILVLFGCLFCLSLQAQTGLEVEHGPILAQSHNSPFHFYTADAPRSSILIKPIKHQLPAILSIIHPPPRREYIIKNGPEKKLYYNDGSRIIETCLGPTGVSCSFYLW